MGEVIGAGELHKGVKLLIDGEPWEITEFDFSKPGKGQAIYNCKLRNMITGGGMSRSYRSGDKFEKPELIQRDVTYSYDDGSAYVFTDENFEEIRVSADVMGDKKYFLMDEIAERTAKAMAEGNAAREAAFDLWFDVFGRERSLDFPEISLAFVDGAIIVVNAFHGCTSPWIARANPVPT